LLSVGTDSRNFPVDRFDCRRVAKEDKFCRSSSLSGVET
jgi:hypothetical protein